MRIGTAALKGYILEELIAYLIQNTGYRLLVSRAQDPEELDNRGNGLVVKGRGAVHQVDVLGQLAWIPAFTFPIRLFVEAKFRSEKTDIRDVRNAVGILEDINQNYSQHSSRRARLQRYTYRYALFSVSGFSDPAVEMARAHQISLVDLSGPSFITMRNIVESLASLIYNDFEEASRPGETLKRWRVWLRMTLGTWPSEDLSSRSFDESRADEWNPQTLSAALPRLEAFERDVRGFVQGKSWFVGMANGPFMLVLQPSDPRAFLRHCQAHPSHRVDIRWSRDTRNEWKIEPTYHDETNAPLYTLAFSLPEALSEWIFSDEVTFRSRAFAVKQQFLSDITIYYRQPTPHSPELVRDNLFRLVYDPVRTQSQIHRQ